MGDTRCSATRSARTRLCPACSPFPQCLEDARLQAVIRGLVGTAGSNGVCRPVVRDAARHRGSHRRPTGRVLTVDVRVPVRRLGVGAAVTITACYLPRADNQHPHPGPLSATLRRGPRPLARPTGPTGADPDRVKPSPRGLRRPRHGERRAVLNQLSRPGSGGSGGIAADLVESVAGRSSGPVHRCRHLAPPSTSMPLETVQPHQYLRHACWMGPSADRRGSAAARLEAAGERWAAGGRSLPIRPVDGRHATQPVATRSRNPPDTEPRDSSEGADQPLRIAVDVQSTR